MKAAVLTGGLMAGLAWLLGWAPAGLVLTPDVFEAGEPWRAVTGHLVHSDWNHLLMNLAGLALCAALFGRQIGWHLTGLLISGGLAVTALVIQTGIFTKYCGLSGALNALFVGGCWLRAGAALTGDRDDADDGFPVWAWALLPVLDLFKILVEMARGDALFSQIAWMPAPEAHLAGWAMGAVYTGFVLVRRSWLWQTAFRNA
jgi:rhomboid family GlyGly-CTERM serine protease